uniref:hypothetical protein n=1 Tax=Roseobacter sp. HKCCA0434 TaxID=3079297 RepID=UPI0029059470
GGLTLAPLGPEGAATLDRPGLRADIAATLPALRAGDQIVAVPGLKPHRDCMFRLIPLRPPSRLH